MPERPIAPGRTLPQPARARPVVQPARGTPFAPSALSLNWAPIAIAALAVLISAYFVARYAGRWAETDTALMTAAIRTMADTGELVTEDGEVYSHGYLYPAVAVVLMAFTGLSAAPTQQVVLPLTSALLVPPAFALYRELCASRQAAALATLLLFTQSEFLFVVLRGSHERVGRALMLICLWLLARSFRLRDNPTQFGLHVLLFYLAAYALVATNVFFGMSFVFAIAVAMAVAWALGRLGPSFVSLAVDAARRLALVALAVLGLGFFFAFYLYGPASESLSVLNHLFERIAALLFHLEPPTDAYGQSVAGWTNPLVYLALSAGSYAILVGSTLLWLWQAFRWLRGDPPAASIGSWLLWLLFSAFALQGMVGIVSDRAGVLGSNLQHRAFPSFAIVGVAILATALVGWCRPRSRQRALAGVVTTLATLGLLKATLDPLVSVTWLLYSPPELRGLIWLDRHAPPGPIWVGPSERLTTAFALETERRPALSRLDDFKPEPSTRLFLISDVIELLSVRAEQSLPIGEAANLIYDNGSTRVYRTRPITPFQR